MQRRAPGWTEGAGVLEPTKRAGGGGVEGMDSFKEGGSGISGNNNGNDIDELGAMLDQLGRQ